MEIETYFTLIARPLTKTVAFILVEKKFIYSIWREKENSAVCCMDVCQLGGKTTFLYNQAVTIQSWCQKTRYRTPTPNHERVNMLQWLESVKLAFRNL